MSWDGALAKLGDVRSRELQTFNVAERYGLDRTGAIDSTSAIQRALDTYRDVYLPRGDYRVTSISVPAGRTLRTDGLQTRLIQPSGTGVYVRILVVTGSDVNIGSLSVKGNIATDTDEQKHGILVQANSTVGNIENVTIGDVYGEDIRGDVVYAGQLTSANTLKNIRIGRVTGKNIYRDVVTFAGVDGFDVESITGEQIGFYHLNCEPAPGMGPCRNGRVGRVKGRMVSLYGSTAADCNENIDIGVLDLSPAFAGQSTPNYLFNPDDAVLTKNVNNISIGELRASGFNRFGFRGTFGAGDLDSQSVRIGLLHLRNCSLTDVTFNSYAIGTGLRMNIGVVDIIGHAFSKRGLQSVKNSYIGSLRFSAGGNASALLDCAETVVGTVTQTGTGYLLQNSDRASVLSGSFTGATLAQGCHKSSFSNMAITTSGVVFNATFEDNVIANSSVNGVYRGLGGVTPLSGTGTPEGVIAAPIGTPYHRLDGGASTTLYIKESGSGNTGWVAK